jgi:hypothetical protein
MEQINSTVFAFVDVAWHLLWVGINYSSIESIFMMFPVLVAITVLIGLILHTHGHN